MINAALVSEQCHCDQNEYHDKHNTLFVLCEFEDTEQALHSIVAEL
jgi:hypothetical protein